jgi:hypothetical protein
VKRSRVLLLSAVAVSTLFLAGCTAATPASSPTSPASTAPVATPTSTPTVAPASAPGPRVQVKCGDFYSTDAVKKLISVTQIDATDETAKPGYIEDVANAQLGELSCNWIGPDGSEVVAAEALGIAVAPDSADAYAKYAPTALKLPQSSARLYTSTAGDESKFWCQAGGTNAAGRNSSECYAQMLVGTYWATVQLSLGNPNTNAPGSVAVGSKRMQKILANVADKLTAAPRPVPQWVAPATTPPAFCTAPTSTAKVRRAFGVPSYVKQKQTSPVIDAGRLAIVGTTATCRWMDFKGKAESLDIVLLAGGSWVNPGFTPKAFADGYVRSFVPATVTGASSAYLGCALDYCDAYMTVGTSLVQVDFSGRGKSKNVAALASLAAAIAAS